MVERFLITVSDELTWKYDRPVLFLGEWCRLHSRKSVWESMNAIVASPYGLGYAAKDRDYANACAIDRELFPALCNVLNGFHGNQYSQRFWRIVLGNWFRRYIDVIINRVKTLEQCIQNYNISGTTVYAGRNYRLAAEDSFSAIFSFNDARWNSELTGRLLGILDPSIPIKAIIDNSVSSYTFKTQIVKSTLGNKAVNWGVNQAKNISKFFSTQGDAFIAGDYLPRKESIKLHLSLRQFPQFISRTKVDFPERLDINLRGRLADQLICEDDTNLEFISKKMLFELLPICYVEGFDRLSTISEQQGWPKKPKFIYTANRFDTDEVFKLWTANKVENGVKYIVGQHGSNYGTHRHWLRSTNEEVTSDKFLTWGWADDLPQHTPAFNFKVTGNKTRTFSSKGGLLLVELPLNHLITTWDGVQEFDSYFKDQKIFVRNLNPMPKRELLVRLHPEFKYHDWDEVTRWHEFDPSINVDFGAQSMDKLVSNSRLVVHSYDSTGFLENLAENIPTLAFWQNGLDHLRDSAKPYYQSLIDAGIIHLTPESVAHHINDVWAGVEQWWSEKKIQEARAQFCERFSRQSKYPIRDLKCLLCD